MSQQYQYRPLESRDTFRLLRLHAGQGDRINCSIHHYTLASAACPSYRAISYTWGKDAARFTVHFADKTVLKIRKNLRNALRTLRDSETDCYLWIDAICINQRSTRERNHQVKLMANIYGNANVVLVWLQSANEAADVTRAFKFINAAASYNNGSQHSVEQYLRAHPRQQEGGWNAVHKLCAMRYWHRKWIIQELVTARTVVLQLGTSECSMADFEAFCQQLHQNRNNDTYTGLVEPRPEIWSLVLGSSASRLALPRLEARDRQHPRLLHELIERYTSNKCQLACDHVYALYSLAGDHRTHLDIDYGSTDVERLIAVLCFVQTHERPPPPKILRITNLLVKLLNIGQEDILHDERRISENLNLAVSAIILGTVEIQPEGKSAIELRKMVKPLHPIRSFSLSTSREPWVLRADGAQQERVGRPDMKYFSVPASGLHGLAACNLQDGDTIWQLPGSRLVYAVRERRGQQASILGRVYLFSPAPAGNGHALEPWLRRPFDYDRVRQGERLFKTNLTNLIELGSAVKEERRTKKQRNFGWGWAERNWRLKILIVGSARSCLPPRYIKYRSVRPFGEPRYRLNLHAFDDGGVFEDQLETQSYTI